mmetsp:Transcript_104708/g.301993  ORF Transcript_104708/g.301993 Transcript_104708/m.301993 type:complete len:202 (-) Transcript_104708:962-1567(-)
MAAQQQQRVVVKIPVRWLRQAVTAITTGTGTGNVRTEQRFPTTRTIRTPVCYPRGSATFTTLPSPPPPLPGARMFQRGQNQPDETVRLVDMSMRCTACCLLCRSRQHGQEGLELDPCPTLFPPPALPLSHSPTLPSGIATTRTPTSGVRRRVPTLRPKRSCCRTRKWSSRSGTRRAKNGSTTARWAARSTVARTARCSYTT